MEFSELIEGLQGRLTRSLLLFFAVVIAVSAYTYVVEFYDPDKNFLRQVWRGIFHESYTFYSGSEGGFYIQIGKLLDQETENGAPLRIHNQESSGGFENATQVMNSSSAFGLVQEDTLRKNDFIREHIRYITPLYLERMHILYRRSRFKKLVGGGGEPLLSPDDEPTKKFFQKATLSTGPHGSGSKIFANYLLTSCKIGSVQDLSLGLKEGLSSLQEGNLDIAFTIAGAPLTSVREALKDDPDLGLMSVDPVLFQSLNQALGLNLRPTTFKGIYDHGREISTIGNYAFLVASRDVPDSAIMQLLSILEGSKHKIEGYNQASSFPLNQFDFKTAFQQEYRGTVMSILQNSFLFVVTVSLTTALAMTFLVWIVSGAKQARYFREMTHTYMRFLPQNTNLDENDPPFPRPIIFNHQSEIVTRLVRGMSQLLSLAYRIRHDYETGGITISHHRHLLENVYGIRAIFQRNLAQRLNEVLATTGELSTDRLRHYYTAGYLNREDFLHLAAQIDGAAVPSASSAA